MALLSEHMTWRGITGADPDEFVFPAPQGGHLDYAHWRRRVWIPATGVAGVEGLAFHDLRRANATGMVLDGINLKTAQTRLGHSDPRLTIAVYAQATTTADAAGAERLGRGSWKSRGLFAAWALPEPLAGQGYNALTCVFPGREGGT